jgi:hypothetical protein
VQRWWRRRFDHSAFQTPLACSCTRMQAGELVGAAAVEEGAHQLEVLGAVRLKAVTTK